MGLKVKFVWEGAKAPTVAHPGEDLGYDLYSVEEIKLEPGKVAKVRCGIAVEATDDYGKPLGLLIRDRSSLAHYGIFTHGGVIDPGYRGEISVLLTSSQLHNVWKGDKIAQMVPVPILTGEVEVVDGLTTASRGEKGFGSSGA